MPFLLKALLLFLAGAMAGLINSVAGGGTLITFPALLFSGAPAIAANATSTVGLLPGSASSVWAYRRELQAQKRWGWRFAFPSLFGGLLGAVLLLHTGETLFREFVPFLILFATVLFTFQAPVTRWLQIEAHAIEQSRHGVAAAIFFQFCVAVYGGYFGAGIGILMLAALGVLGQKNVHEMNSLKTLMAVLINGVAVVYFIARGSVLWPEAGTLALGAILGGYTGPVLARKVGARPVRVFVSAAGFAIGIYFLVR